MTLRDPSPFKTNLLPEYGAKYSPKTAVAAPLLPKASLQHVKSFRISREQLDEVVFFFILIFFVKLFLVEHYKIPSGSMTPTLIGGEVAYLDLNHDEITDIVYWDSQNREAIAFINQDGHYVRSDDMRISNEMLLEWTNKHLFKFQYDYILVNKLTYWFRQPKRSDIVVFKAPPPVFSWVAPIYIKRVVGLPNEWLSFDQKGFLLVNGKFTKNSPFFRFQRYQTLIDPMVQGFERQSAIQYQSVLSHLESGSLKEMLQIQRIHVPDDQVYVFGDNTQGSLDSRFWGGVPLENLKGKAFARLYPLKMMGFLK